MLYSWSESANKSVDFDPFYNIISTEQYISGDDSCKFF